MLGKIWGLALLVLGIYVAYEVLQLQDGPATGSSPKIAHTLKTKAEAPPDPTPAELEEAAVEAQVALRYEPKSEEEITASITQICEEMEDELQQEARISPAFNQIRIKYREERLKVEPLKALISSCFRKTINASSNLEIEVFSSEFGGEARNQVQLQVSVFDKDFHNKIYEVGRRFETVKIYLDRPATNPQE